MPLIMIDVVPSGQAYIDANAVVAIVPRHDAIGCTVMLRGGHEVTFPGNLEQAQEAILARES